MGSGSSNAQVIKIENLKPQKSPKQNNRKSKDITAAKKQSKSPPKKGSLSQSHILYNKVKFNEMQSNQSVTSGRSSELSKRNKIKSVKKLPLQSMTKIQSVPEQNDNLQSSQKSHKKRQQFHKLIRIYDLN